VSSEGRDVTEALTQTVEDEVRRVAVVRLSAKLHSCQCIVDAGGKAKVRDVSTSQLTHTAVLWTY